MLVYGEKPELKPVLINKAGQRNLLQEFNNYLGADILSIDV